MKQTVSILIFILCAFSCGYHTTEKDKYPLIEKFGDSVNTKKYSIKKITDEYSNYIGMYNNALYFERNDTVILLDDNFKKIKEFKTNSGYHKLINNGNIYVESIEEYIENAERKYLYFVDRYDFPDYDKKITLDELSKLDELTEYDNFCFISTGLTTTVITKSKEFYTTDDSLYKNLEKRCNLGLNDELINVKLSLFDRAAEGNKSHRSGFTSYGLEYYELIFDKDTLRFKVYNYDFNLKYIRNIMNGFKRNQFILQNKYHDYYLISLKK